MPELREALDESNLPFLVDLHLWEELPDTLHDRICEAYGVIQEAGVALGSGRRAIGQYALSEVIRMIGVPDGI